MSRFWAPVINPCWIIASNGTPPTSVSGPAWNQSNVCSRASGERRGLASMPSASARVVPPSIGPFSNTSPSPFHSREANRHRKRNSSRVVAPGTRTAAPRRRPAVRTRTACRAAATRGRARRRPRAARRSSRRTRALSAREAERPRARRRARRARPGRIPGSRAGPHRRAPAHRRARTRAGPRSAVLPGARGSRAGCARPRSPRHLLAERPRRVEIALRDQGLGPLPGLPRSWAGW